MPQIGAFLAMLLCNPVNGLVCVCRFTKVEASHFLALVFRVEGLGAWASRIEFGRAGSVYGLLIGIEFGGRGFGRNLILVDIVDIGTCEFKLLALCPEYYRTLKM